VARDLESHLDAAPGVLRRFLLESQPLRGNWVQLGAAWPALRAHHRYPPAIDALLGQAATAAVLLTATLKFAGTLTLQLSGSGKVRLLVAQCTDDYTLRAMAEHESGISDEADFATLVGSGRLAVTLQPDASTAQYQGIVPLEGRDLAECLERYFESSEQLPTRLSLAADTARAGGMLVQKLPAESGGERAGAAVQEIWEELEQGLRSLSSHELLSLGAEDAVRRVCGTHDCRLFDVTPVRFGCRCSDSRVAGLVRSLGIDEAHDAVAEQGSLTVTCEFCGRGYSYDAVDIEQLFAADTPPQHKPGRYN